VQHGLPTRGHEKPYDLGASFENVLYSDRNPLWRLVNAARSTDHVDLSTVAICPSNERHPTGMPLSPAKGTRNVPRGPTLDTTTFALANWLCPSAKADSENVNPRWTRR